MVHSPRFVMVQRSPRGEHIPLDTRQTLQGPEGVNSQRGKVRWLEGHVHHVALKIDDDLSPHADQLWQVGLDNVADEVQFVVPRLLHVPRLLVGRVQTERQLGLDVQVALDVGCQPKAAECVTRAMDRQ